MPKNEGILNEHKAVHLILHITVNVPACTWKKLAVWLPQWTFIIAYSESYIGRYKWLTLSGRIKSGIHMFNI